jgi:hypothetical protein
MYIANRASAVEERGGRSAKKVATGKKGGKTTADGG